MPWRYRAARPADLPALCALLAATGALEGARTPEAVERELWGLWQSTGWSPLDQVVAEGEAALVGTLCHFRAGNRGRAFEGPHLLPEGPDAAAFVRGALQVLAERHAYAQALTADPLLSAALAAGGMPRLASLLEMERPAGSPGTGRGGSPLAWRPVASIDELESLITLTLEGTSDIPALKEALPASEILAGYRPSGGTPPPGWEVAETGGEAVACLLLNPLPGGWMELKYMGVKPGARGRGFGRALVDRALKQAGSKGMRVAVDQDNGPARKLYETAGFRLLQTKSFHFVAFPLKPS